MARLTSYHRVHWFQPLIFFFFISFPSFSQPEELYFKHLSVEDGLSHGTVRCIFQDHKGYMWFGTEYGLNQYDGYEFTVYRNDPLDSTSIDNNFITYITEDSKGRLWVGTSGSLNYFDRDLHIFKHYMHDPHDPFSIAHGPVRSILEDHNGTLWVSTPGMLQKFDLDTGKFTKYLTKDDQGNFLDWTGDLFEDSKNNLWLASIKGVRLFDQKKKTFTNPLNDSHDYVDEQVEFDMTMMEDRNGDLWVASRGDGIRKYSYKDKVWYRYRYNENNRYGSSSNYNYVNGILEDQDGQIWASSGRTGLYSLDVKSQKFYHIDGDVTDDNSLNDKSLNTLYEDLSGGIWIAKWNGGLSYLQKNFYKFQHFTNDGSDNCLSSNLVQSVTGDPHGNLWIGTEGSGGLNYYSKKDKTFTKVIAPPSVENWHLGSLNIKSLLYSRAGKVWIGTLEGLDRYDSATLQWVHYRHDPGNNRSIMPGFVSSLLEDVHGYIWVGLTRGGLNRLDPTSGEFTYFPYNSEEDGKYATILSLLEDKAGLIWLGTQEDGLLSFNPDTEEFTSFRDIVSDYPISCIHEDDQGLLWVATGGQGLKSFDRVTGNISVYDKKAGLPSNFIYGILRDDTGQFWISTADGISCFDPSDLIFQNYNVSDGLQSNQFHRSAFFKNATGDLYFGGPNGLNIIQPREIISNAHPPSVQLRDFYLFNKSVEIGADNSPLSKHISNTDQITLNHKQSVMTFEFAALNFIAPEKNQYAYMLDPYDEDWNMVGTRRFASYTNLPPGDYTFKVKASNNDDVWNEKGISIDLTVLPKPWLTWWAYLIYAAIVLALFYFFRAYELSRMKVKNELMLEKLSHLKYKEMHQLKMNFFTNISHELRSPLTLILSPLETLISNNKTDHFVQKQYRLMERNVQKLLRLINQLLDFRKVELGMLKLRAAKGDLVKFTMDITHVFKSIAAKKNIRLNLKCDVPFLELWFDWDKLEKTLSNLISNAIKFTPDGGEVEINIHQDKVLSEGLQRDFAVVEIKDSGPGISQDKLPLIFERFYQVSPDTKTNEGGFGIGLAFAKELVDMHHGLLKVESEEGKGSIFIVMLPLGRSHLEPEEIVVFSDSGKEEIVSEAMLLEEDNITLGKDKAISKPTILIVDDDADVRAYLHENLISSYQIIEASNGMEAWHLTKEKMPYLILSDVLMPVMDGIEYCKLIKTNMDFCHIPILLLTALSAVEHRISGVEAGADVYIPKPFNLQLLRATIASQLEKRKLLKLASQSNLLLSPQDYSPTSMDKDFLEKVIRVIDEHLDEADFDMTILYRTLSMSSSSLYRKLKALTDQSTNEFVRNIRLSRASELLKQTNLNISEISYKVGFTDPKYFSTCFRKRYDMTPSKFMTIARKGSKSAKALLN